VTYNTGMAKSSSDKRKRVIRRLKKIAIISLISIVSFYVLIVILLNTPIPVKIINKKLGFVKIESIHGIPPFSLTVRGINYDKDGMKATVEKVKLRLNPFMLITKTVCVNEFTVIKPQVSFDMTYVPPKTPSGEPSAETPAQTKPKSDKLPWKIDIRKASIVDLQRTTVITKDGTFAVSGLNLEASLYAATVTPEGNAVNLSVTAQNGIIEMPAVKKPMPFTLAFSVNYTKGTDLKTTLDLKISDIMKNLTKLGMGWDISGNITKQHIDIGSLNAELNGKRIMDVSAATDNFMDLKKITYEIRHADISMDIAETLSIVKSNFMPNLPAEGSGSVTFKGSGSFADYRGAIQLSNGAFTFGTVKANGIGVDIAIAGKQKSLTVDIKAGVKSITETKLKQTVNNVNFDTSINLTQFSQVGRVTVHDISLTMYGGMMALKGHSDFMRNLDYTLTLRDFTYLKYFNIPLTTRITADMHVTGENMKSVSVVANVTVKDIDFRKDAMIVKMPSCALNGTVIIDVDRQFVYCDEISLSVGDRSRVFINGYAEKWGTDKLNLDLKETTVDIGELRTFISVMQPFDIGGQMHLSAEIRGTAKDPWVKGDVTLTDIIFADPKTGLKADGIKGQLWYDFTMPKTTVVLELGCKSVRMQGIGVDEIQITVPYTFAPKTTGQIKLTNKYNLFIKKVQFNQYEFNDISASLAAYNKNVALRGLLIHFLDGQIGGDVTLDMDTMTYNFALSGIEINLRKATNKSGTSIFAFASKFSGKKTDMTGYFDITRIDNDVLDKLLISLDPDKKNPQVQGIRSKLNMVGVVPKNIRVTIENGYIDIIPEFTTRRATFISMILGLFVGNVEVEPIRRIPLKAILKELNLEV